MLLSRWLCGALAAVSLAAAAQPFVPGSDAEVLERLPTRLWKAKPAVTPNAQQTWAEARQLVEMGRRDGDPRYLGQAQARLAKWWSLPQPPAPVLLLRATILQSLHDFDGALRDLDQLIGIDPRDAQARLVRATIRLAQGRPAEAQADCLALGPRVVPLVIVTCATQAASLAGQAPASYAALEAALEGSPSAEPAIRAWALVSAAEMAHRMGRPRHAEEKLRAALALDPGDAYAIGTYADLLLQEGRAAEVLALIGADERNDALGLRRVLALAALKHDRLARERDAMRERLAAQRLRGATLHAREEARFRLAFDNDMTEALRLAQENWKTQREPPDLLLLLEAARRAGRPAAAQPARDWIRATGYMDVRLRPEQGS